MRLGLGVRHQRPGGLRPVEKGKALFVEQLSQVGYRKLARRAMKQLHGIAILESRKVPAQPAFGYREMPAGGADATMFDNRREHGEIRQIIDIFRLHRNCRVPPILITSLRTNTCSWNTMFHRAGACCPRRSSMQPESLRRPPATRGCR